MTLDTCIGEGAFQSCRPGALVFGRQCQRTCVAELLDFGAIRGRRAGVRVGRVRRCPGSSHCPDGAEPFGSGDHLTDLALELILTDANLYVRGLSATGRGSRGTFSRGSLWMRQRERGSLGIRYRQTSGISKDRMLRVVRPRVAREIRRQTRPLQTGRPGEEVRDVCRRGALLTYATARAVALGQRAALRYAAIPLLRIWNVQYAPVA